MNRYNVTVESINEFGEPETRMLQDQKAKSAQECHKACLWDLSATDEIVNIFDQGTGKMVYQKNRGFIG